MNENGEEGLPIGVTSEDPAQLVRRAQCGSDDAFEALLRIHFDVAYAVAFSITANAAYAEDVCQDAFVRAWKRLGQCKDPSRFRAWFARVVRSVALNWKKKHERGRHPPLHAAHLPVASQSPERDLGRARLRHRLSEAIRHLTPQQRQVLVLYDLEGFPHKEIADLLEISEMMSRRSLSDARQRMRALLDEPGSAAETGVG